MKNIPQNIPFDPLAPSSLALPAAIAVSDADTDPLALRRHPESAHPYRSAYVRDCGRILHARAFRRLAGKTQVFTRSQTESDLSRSDHSRSRLTHTLEVAQIARTVSASLSLNVHLAEALALVHDIGHPPFGHAGEEALDRALRDHGLGFDHNLHALRIVNSFEERYAAFPGLNLTLGVREGIVKHSRDYNLEHHPELSEYFLNQRPPLEAQLIDLADEIAYLTSDIEDGLAAGIFALHPLTKQVPLFADLYRHAEREFPSASPRLLTSEALKQMLNALVTDLMQQIASQIRDLGIRTLAELRSFPHRIARFSPQIEAQRHQTKSFLYANLYQSPELEVEHAHAEEVIQTLFTAWTKDPELLPAAHLARVHEEGAPRAVADYIAGMTDAYIEQAWTKYRETRGR